MGSTSHFQATQHHKVKYSPHSISEYVSKRTGMRVVVVDQKGPKVLGSFAAATEIWDDSGSPHTLEHLCFMGSRSYPFKGLLDQLATRGYSTTNAWTATDHTAYTLETAGYAAFAKILPIYLEHIILPTLTDSGCYTEVFHIDGEGHDAGVVYSEMQGVQNTQSEIMELRSKRLMYPEGVGFRYETGGRMEQLRILSAERIRQFHREMYQPKNLCLVIIGQVDQPHLLHTLDKFEDSIITRIPSPDAPFKRPWLHSGDPLHLTQTFIESVDFPEEDEAVGEISIKYFGPTCNDQVQTTALNVVLSYLAGSSASVLENVLVEKEQVATAVYYQTTPRPDSIIEFTLTGVDTEKLEQVERRFIELINETAGAELDMEFLRDWLDREKRQQMYSAETSDQFFTSSVINTFLFSESRNLSYLSHLGEFDELDQWSEKDWRNFLKKWIASARRITILGRPSAALAKKLAEEEEARVADQIKRLGETGLEKLKKKLQDAKESNDAPIPKEILEDFEVPSTDTIHFVSTTPACFGQAKKTEKHDNSIQRLIDSQDSDSPLFIHFEHIPSNFVHINILLCTSTIPIELRPMLSIYLGNFFTTPVTRNGKRLEFEDVVKELDRDTIGYGFGSAAKLSNAEMLTFGIQVEADKYKVAIQWAKDLLSNSIFDLERIYATVVRTLQDIPEEKRSGTDMGYAAATMVGENASSIMRARCTLVKAPHLKRVKRLLKTNPEKVLQQLESLRKNLYQASNLRILVIADIEKLREPVTAWDIFTEGLNMSKPLAKLDDRMERLTQAGKEPGNLSYIIPMATIDSSFAVSVAKGIEKVQDPRLPALMVSIAYLDAVEGPLWTAVRGAGLAYGTGFRRRTGQMEFSVYRSPDSFKAFVASRRVLEAFVNGTRELDSFAMEGAVSQIVLSTASAQATLVDAAADKIALQVVKEVPRDYYDTLLEKVRNVTKEEVKTTIRNLLLPLFSSETSNVFVTCAPVMQESLVKGFSTIGYKPEIRNLASFQDDYGLKTGDEDADAEGSDDSLDGSEEGSVDGNDASDPEE